MTMERVRFRRLPHNPDLPLPARQTPGSAGYDVASAEPDFVLQAGERRLVATGLAMELPADVECQVRPRSGLALKHGVTVLNSPGTVDADYRGEVQVLLVNLGQEPFTVTRGMRIAQMVVAPVTSVELVEVEQVDDTARSGGGFGSTGVR